MESNTICERIAKENGDSEKTVNDPDQNIEKNTESTSSLNEKKTPASVISRKRKAITEDRRLDEVFEIHKTSSQTISDECQHFGNLVAAKLRKFNEDVRTSLESDIMELFVKANRGFYNIPFTRNNLLQE